jgi:hypothetical protein
VQMWSAVVIAAVFEFLVGCCLVKLCLHHVLLAVTATSAACGVCGIVAAVVVPLVSCNPAGAVCCCRCC